MLTGGRSGPKVGYACGKTCKIMDKYVCIICGYIYDPAEGDPETGIAPGTPFEELPKDWTCPACGVGLEHFEKMK